MTRTALFSLRFLTLAAILALSLAPLRSHAEEVAPAAPASTVAASAATDAAAPVEKPLSEQEKAATIQAADSIAAFDASKVVGIAKDWQIYFQESATPIKHEVKILHDGVMIVITLITILVLVLLVYVALRFNKRANPKPQTFTHNKLVEFIWTAVPIIILVGIAIPSIRVHYNYYYNQEALEKPDLSVKVVGHQWYWEYEYPDQGIKFDSNMTKDADLPEGAPRLLEVDNALVVPVNKVVRVQLTAADVIHAWALPSFGIKKGAVPGRLNETWFKAEKEGIYYGQCSVLCGKLHGYMPIKVVVVSDEQFAQWVKGAKLKFAAGDHLQFASLN